MKPTIGIIGGGGYTAGELIRLLIRHPGVELKFVVSGSQAGKLVSSVHDDLVGETDLVFVNEPGDADVIFLCMGHGKSSGWMEENQPSADTIIVDLSTDFRMDESWVYGLPELNREATRRAKRIANPGCFATAIQLAALPLAAAGLIEDPLHVNAITGSTGAGQSPGSTTHFSWRNNNVSIYKAFEHQHEAEIGRSIQQLNGKGAKLHFLPVRGNFARGIYCSLYTQTSAPETLLLDAYHGYFEVSAFTHLMDEEPHLKQVVNTNKGLVNVRKIGDQVLVVSMIDNLLKGASGQAVQNMNLALGLEETAGLLLKASAF